MVDVGGDSGERLVPAGVTGAFGGRSEQRRRREREMRLGAAAPLLRAAAERTRDPGWHQAFATVATNIDHRRTVLKELE